MKAARKGLPAFVYFNNDLNTRAPLNAHAMMKLVGKFAVRPLAADAAAQPLQIAPPIVGPEKWRPWTRPAKKGAPVAARQQKKKTAARPTRARRKSARREEAAPRSDRSLATKRRTAESAMATPPP